MAGPTNVRSFSAANVDAVLQAVYAGLSPRAQSLWSRLENEFRGREGGVSAVESWLRSSLVERIERVEQVMPDPSRFA